ncbi:hypothetical protein QFC19_006651 [Naganishia cerealis]|uniref:Uncharacterized protein n=1 Tax=Naganishia cerealis TaxID=610337 RepID=A0ACC2VFU6_9TREE|nr:hypothetical protein QFC19_006651 [Naganishia cerealis]
MGGEREFPDAATQWSNLLSSGLAPATASIGTGMERPEAVKRWRMSLERADLVKKKVVAMGGEIAVKPVAPRVEVVGPVSHVGAAPKRQREEEAKRRRREDEAEQITYLRRSSLIQHQRQTPDLKRTAATAPTQTTGHPLRLPLWHDADATFLAPLTSTQLAALTVRPDFSPDQKALAAEWKNVYAAPSPSWVPFEPFLSSKSAAALSSHDAASVIPIKVSQGIGANCSVVAGLNVLVAHNARQKGTRALGVCNFVDVKVKPEKSGGEDEGGDGRRYWRVKVFVNGAWRSLVIDSCLPISTKTDEPLHCTVTPDPPIPSCLSLPSLLWLAFLEKTYTSLLASSYAFPGSTPSTDLFHLTSWIPEHIPLARGSFQRERTWQRVKKGWEDGTVLITLGTGKDDRRRHPHAGVLQGIIRDPRVVPLHAYAVMDVMHGRPGGEGGDERKVKIVNPWRRGRSRTGSNGREWTRGVLQSLIEEAEDDDAEQDDPPDSIEITVSALSPGAEVWILLQRHITTFATAASAAGTFDTSENEGGEESGISMAVQLVESMGDVIRAQDVWARRSGEALEYTSSSWILIPVEFSGRTAGGNPSLPTFMYNPQYRVHVKPDILGKTQNALSSIKCQLTGDDQTSYNVKLVWNRGERVTDLQAQDVVADSGEYRYGHTSVTKADVGVGVYTLVVSSFEANKIFKASVKIQSTSPLDISPIPQEGAGMFSRVVKGQWSGFSAAGCPSLGSYENNPRYEMLLPEPATVLCRLQLAATTGTPIPISIAIFKRGPSGSLKEQVATSGPYADPISGVVCPQTHFEAGIYVLVPSTYASGTEANYVISVYATRKIELSAI